MELKFLIFRFIFFPYIIYGMKTPCRYADDVAKIKNYTNEGTMIVNNILRLNKNGFLYERYSGFFYAGQLEGSGHPVAIEFVPNKHIQFAKVELRIFKKLKAYNNFQIEEKGFPNVYYHCEWESYTLIARTKLYQSLDDIRTSKNISPLDMLILLKNFVIQTRHMHGLGISHGNVDFKCIMLRSNQSFITDFKNGRIMKDKEKFELTRRDWKDFLIMIAMHYGFYQLNWIAIKDRLRRNELNEGLKTVIEEFGDEAFSEDDSDDDSDDESDSSSKDFPKYNYLEEIIDIEINKSPGNSGSPPKFSWLSN